MTVFGVSDLGWTITDDIPTAKRPGPHNITNGNGREIWFRNSSVADLLIATMWMLHTGCAGKFNDQPVYLFHGFRQRNADFGSANSDHMAGVAFDQNWDAHPWERTVGTPGYDSHMRQTKYDAAHDLFEAVETRMRPPGKRSLVRWCGRPWLTPAGWTAYPRGYRDCMHWVIEAPDWDRIHQHRDWLHTWFVPPRTVDDIKAWQRRVGVKADGVWGRDSVSSMRTLQKQLRVSRTGLPGDLSTWRAYRTEIDKPTTTTTTTRRATTTTTTTTSRPKPNPEVARMRIAGPNAYATAVSLDRFEPTDSNALILAVRGSVDHVQAGIVAGRYPNVSVLPVAPNGSLPSEIRDEIASGRFDQVYLAGGPTAIPDETGQQILEILGNR